jgi:hypothetical protein
MLSWSTCGTFCASTASTAPDSPGLGRGRARRSPPGGLSGQLSDDPFAHARTPADVRGRFEQVRSRMPPHRRPMGLGSGRRGRGPWSLTTKADHNRVRPGPIRTDVLWLQGQMSGNDRQAGRFACSRSLARAGRILAAQQRSMLPPAAHQRAESHQVNRHIGRWRRCTKHSTDQKVGGSSPSERAQVNGPLPFRQGASC